MLRFASFIYECCAGFRELETDGGPGIIVRALIISIDFVSFGGKLVSYRYTLYTTCNYSLTLCMQS